MLRVPLKLRMSGFSVGGHILDANGKPVGHPEMVHEYNALAARVAELEAVAFERVETQNNAAATRGRRTVMKCIDGFSLHRWRQETVFIPEQGRFRSRVVCEVCGTLYNHEKHGGGLEEREEKDNECH